MDRDTSDAINRLDTKMDRQEEKIDKLNDQVANWRTESASIMAVLTAKSQEYERRAGHTVTIWIGILLALISSALSWMFTGKK